ncbi:PBS lyase HEAT domain protein repeat-containing protein [Chondrocystis sp. NIES-4102]|nr:PBS lyase HEAT domain protein repeat-containing protein [Chondrocystis sp. NIES-4102]
MTQIKLETVNQSLNNIQVILNFALTAAHQKDWLQVHHFLQLLPQSTSRKQAKLLLIEGEDWQLALELALMILFEGDFEHKWEITKVLPLFGDPVVPTLTKLLADETIAVDIRWFICQVLGSFKTPEVIINLVKLLDLTTDSDLIAIALKTLTQIGNGAIEALVKLLDTPTYRLLAVQSLFYLHTRETIEPLLTVINDSKSEVRTLAIKALASFHDQRIPPILIQALQDTASSVRKEAAIALGFRCDLSRQLDLVTHLQPLLKDLNLEVSTQAAISLGRMQQPEAATVLFQVLQLPTTPLVLKLDLIKALGRSELSIAIDYLQQVLFDSEDLIIQKIITVLGRINTPELKIKATQILVDFWQHSNQGYNSPQIMQVLATSLGELRCDCAKATLTSLAQATDRKVQLHALAALKKIK